jgi:hypothetical protein
MHDDQATGEQPRVPKDFRRQAHSFGAEGASRQEALPVTKITPVNEGGWGGGVGGPPLRDHLWQGPPLPVTLRLIHPRLR